MHELDEITSGLRFPEGPIAMPDGSVILVEMFGPRLTRVTPDGTKETNAEIAGGPNGAAIGPDGACTSATTAAASARSSSAICCCPGRTIRAGTAVGRFSVSIWRAAT